GDRVPGRGVAGNGFDLGESGAVRAAKEHLLDRPVLVAEGDLQVEDLLAVALETEVPRLDDPGVNRPDRHLVHLVALDPEEVGEDGVEGNACPGAVERREERGEPPSGRDAIDYGPAELGERGPGEVRQGEGDAVSRAGEDFAHGRTSRLPAASRSRCASGAGI